jgi:hypothetical protein
MAWSTREDVMVHTSTCVRPHSPSGQGLVQIAKNSNSMNSTIFVLFGKYCPIMDQLGLKDSSRDLQLNCVISYFFTYI